MSKYIIFYKDSIVQECVLVPDEIATEENVNSRKGHLDCRYFIVDYDNPYKIGDNVKWFENHKRKSNKRLIKEKFIELEDTQKLNADDTISQVELGSDEYYTLHPEKLGSNMKLIKNKDNKFIVVPKSLQELVKDGVITADEYNDKIIKERQFAYNRHTDPLVIEKLIELLSEQGVDVQDILDAKQKIKEELKKYESL